MKNTLPRKKQSLKIRHPQWQTNKQASSKILRIFLTYGSSFYFSISEVTYSGSRTKKVKDTMKLQGQLIHIIIKILNNIICDRMLRGRCRSPKGDAQGIVSTHRNNSLRLHT